MFRHLKILAEMIRIIRRGENVGDAAALKLSLLGNQEEPSEFSDAVLANREKNFAPIDLTTLERCPEGSFGLAYFHFMRRNKLHPFNFSERVFELFERFPVSMRYVRVHDLIHVLLGFETTIEGELGVYAFVARQNYNRTLNRAASAADFVGSLFFWKRKAIQRIQQRGHDLARNAKVLIAQPLEGMWERPLVALRVDLGLAPEADELQ